MGWEDFRNGAHARGEGQITPVMRRVRAKPFAVRRDVYLRERLMEQHAWYGVVSRRPTAPPCSGRR